MGCTHQWHRDSTRDTVRILRYRCALCPAWGQKVFGAADATIRPVTAYTLGCWGDIDVSNVANYERRSAAERG